MSYFFYFSKADFDQIIARFSSIDAQNAELKTLLNALSAQITKGLQLMAVNLDSINAQIATLTADVAADKTVEESAVTLITGMAKQLTDLAAQISDLKAGTVTQQQLDDVAAQMKAQSDALASNSKALSDAVVANTPAAP
jgi:chromosome segregation ATPase